MATSTPKTSTKRSKGFEVKIVDNGLQAFFARVTGSPDVSGEVGVLDGDAETVKIARIHELGLGNMPQRSFLRRTMELFKDRYAALGAKAYGMFLDGKWTIEQAMNAVNAEVESDVKKTILRGIPPKLKPATIKAKQKKGMPRPKTALYATGRLFSSIKHRVKTLGGAKAGTTPPDTGGK